MVEASFLNNKQNRSAWKPVPGKSEFTLQSVRHVRWERYICRLRLNVVVEYCVIFVPVRCGDRSSFEFPRWKTSASCWCRWFSFRSKGSGCVVCRYVAEFWYWQVFLTNKQASCRWTDGCFVSRMPTSFVLLTQSIDRLTDEIETILSQLNSFQLNDSSIHRVHSLLRKVVRVYSDALTWKSCTYEAVSEPHPGTYVHCCLNNKSVSAGNLTCPTFDRVKGRCLSQISVNKAICSL